MHNYKCSSQGDTTTTVAVSENLAGTSFLPEKAQDTLQPGQKLKNKIKKLQDVSCNVCARRLFLLDMLLGNADRLPCAALGWRGNPHNILFCTAGAHAGRMVAIDSAVQRRPPGGTHSNSRSACHTHTPQVHNLSHTPPTHSL